MIFSRLSIIYIIYIIHDLKMLKVFTSKCFFCLFYLWPSSWLWADSNVFNCREASETQLVVRCDFLWDALSKHNFIKNNPRSIQIFKFEFMFDEPNGRVQTYSTKTGCALPPTTCGFAMVIFFGSGCSWIFQNKYTSYRIGDNVFSL